VGFGSDVLTPQSSLRGAKLMGQGSQELPRHFTRRE